MLSANNVRLLDGVIVPFSVGLLAAESGVGVVADGVGIGVSSLPPGSVARRVTNCLSNFSTYFTRAFSFTT